MSLVVDIQKTLGDFHLNVSFETNDSTLGLLGPSGCGKSMTLKCIAGIETPDYGHISLNGVTLFDSKSKINLPPQERHVGYLFQNYALFPNMNVHKNILCGLKKEKNKSLAADLYNESIRMLQLEGLENHFPYQLSGGQAQRVALARIIVNRPNLLLLDEPFSALDSHLRDRVQIEMKDLLKKYGKDTLLVTHSRDEAYHMCKNIAVFNRGTLETPKPVKELFANPGTPAAAKLTGCKNVTPAVKSGEYEVTVPAWGNIRLQTKEPVLDKIKAIGIRAHYFNPSTPFNRNHVTFEAEMEEPFETIILFRFNQQTADSPSVWWRLPKDRRLKEFPSELGIAPANILLLY